MRRRESLFLANDVTSLSQIASQKIGSLTSPHQKVTVLHLSLLVGNGQRLAILFKELDRRPPLTSSF